VLIRVCVAVETLAHGVLAAAADHQAMVFSPSEIALLGYRCLLLYTVAAILQMSSCLTFQISI
jgi:hypothetical protein